MTSSVTNRLDLEKWLREHSVDHTTLDQKTYEFYYHMWTTAYLRGHLQGTKLSTYTIDQAVEKRSNT